MHRCILACVILVLAVGFQFTRSFQLFLALDLHGSLSVDRISSVFDLTVGMVPLVARVAGDPGFPVDLAIIGSREVHLQAVVALLVGSVALVAELTETDPLVPDRLLHLLELGLLSGYDGVLLLCLARWLLSARRGWLAFGGGLHLLQGRKALSLGQVVRAAKFVVAVLQGDGGLCSG